MKAFIVLQVEVPDSNPDLDYRVGMMLGHGGSSFDNVECIDIQEADEDALDMDGPPTLMYP